MANANEISEQLFKAIDAIVQERLRTLPFDKTVIATIVDNSNAKYGKYKVTTDNNISFYAYSEVTIYPLNTKVYVRIPENDYTKIKVITGRYIPEGYTESIKNIEADIITQDIESSLNFDSTVIGTIIENNEANYGKYKIQINKTTTIYAYSDVTNYKLNSQVYIRIPKGNIKNLCTITGRYIPEDNNQLISELIN